MKLDFDSLSILILGDVNVNRSRPASIFGNTANLLRDADITLANLEGVIADDTLESLPGKVEAGSGGYLRMRPGVEQGLAEVGIDAVSVANNHVMDAGEKGLYQNLQALDRVGIGHAGSGKNLEEAHQPCILERRGFKVGLLAYTSVYVPVSFPATEKKPGAAVIGISTAYEVPYNIAYQPGTPARALTFAKAEHKERMLEDVRQAKRKADYVVVSFHWGLTHRGIARSLRLPEELCPAYTVDYQEDLGRAAVDAGADIVFGHHPNEVQGMERYRGKLICYSVGTFSNDGKMPILPAHLGGVMLRCELDADKNWRYSYIPLWKKSVQKKEPKFPNLKQRKQILDWVTFVSQKYGTTFRDEGDTVVVCGPEV